VKVDGAQFTLKPAGGELHGSTNLVKKCKTELSSRLPQPCEFCVDVGNHRVLKSVTARCVAAVGTTTTATATATIITISTSTTTITVNSSTSTINIISTSASASMSTSTSTSTTIITAKTRTTRTI